MELEQLRNDLIAVVNHYGKTVPIGSIFYVVKDFAREITDAYDQWLDSQAKAKEAKEAEKVEQVSGEVEE